MHNCRLIINTVKIDSAKKIFNKFQLSYLENFLVTKLNFELYSGDKTKLLVEFKISNKTFHENNSKFDRLELLNSISNIWSIHLQKDVRHEIQVRTAICQKTIFNAIEWINFEFDN